MLQTFTEDKNILESILYALSKSLTFSEVKFQREITLSCLWFTNVNRTDDLISAQSNQLWKESENCLLKVIYQFLIMTWVSQKSENR